jgi:hypothetical protein
MFAGIRVMALEAGIKPQTDRCANQKERNDILIPDEAVNFVRCCEVICVANIDDRHRRAFVIEWTERIHSFKPTRFAQSGCAKACAQYPAHD